MVQTDATIDCFCCGKQMGNWIYETSRSDGTVSRVNVHPIGGLHFRTYGHYGSRVFDPMDGKGTTLDIAICDECVIGKAKRVHGTGIQDVHEMAMVENQQYRDEHIQKDEQLLAIFEQTLTDLERNQND